MQVSQNRVNANGEGHWEITVRKLSACCDMGEERETIEELMLEQQAA